MRTHTHLLLIPLLLLLIVVLLAACEALPVSPQPPSQVTETLPPEQPIATETVSATEEPGVTAVPGFGDEDMDRIRESCQEAGQLGAEMEQYLPDGLEVPPFQGLIYVADQVIVGGEDEAIEEVVQNLEPLHDGRIPLEEEIGRLPLTDTGRSLVLYQVSPDVRVEQLACEVNAVADALGVSVHADPNYFSSPGGWHGGGSPWTQNGGWSEGIPGGGLGEADPQAFLNQWALADEGIQLLSGPGRQRITELSGEGVPVAVFDSSPFSEQDEGTSWEDGRCQDCYDWLALGEDWLRTTAVDPAPLSVWHYAPADEDTCPGQNRITGDDLEASQDISSHGLFVAGLIQAVAPQSDITLIRVLNKDGCGDLYTIARAILDYLAASESPGSVVLNLSLGVHQPEEPSQFGLPREVTTLQWVVDYAAERGALVIAAAGNDSFDLKGVRDAEIPAVQGGVIGVAATTIDNYRSCYSNSGDISAPGGDGFDPTNLSAEFQETFAAEIQQGHTCLVPGNIGTNEAPAYYCSQEDPSKCLVSLARDPDTGYYRYVYWTGTSFATPLVSGLAALLRPEVGSADQVAQVLVGTALPVLDPDPVPLGAGVISVESATAP